VKASVHGAFRGLVQNGNNDGVLEGGQEEPMETSKELSGMDPQPLESDPKHLMETHGESRQEK
jgi:hypothetical protein